jgi:putative fructose-bisphosphate aldolase
MIGIFSKTIDSNLLEALGYSALDFIIIDQEHGFSNNETLANHIRALKGKHCKSIVRVKELNHQEIGKAFDLDSDGVQVPNISSVEEAQKAIDAARFFPIGNRGVCRFVASAEYGTKERKQYFSDANKKLLILQVEGKEGIENINAILKLDGYDILFVGPYDLSQSLGIPGEVESPKVIELCYKVLNEAKKYNKKVGIFADNIALAKKMREVGFEYIAYSVDFNIFINACNIIVEKIK